MKCIWGVLTVFLFQPFLVTAGDEVSFISAYNRFRNAQNEAVQNNKMVSLPEVSAWSFAKVIYGWLPTLAHEPRNCSERIDILVEHLGSLKNEPVFRNTLAVLIPLLIKEVPEVSQASLEEYIEKLLASPEQLLTLFTSHWATELPGITEAQVIQATLRNSLIPLLNQNIKA